MLYTILYTTNANRSFTNEELQRLNKASRNWNRSHNVTGCLAYIEGVLDGNTRCQIIHVLEGSKGDVENIFNQIKLDMRQKNLSVVKVGFIKSRKFNDWTMGCERIQLNDNPFLEGFFFLNNRVLSQDGSLEENILMQFMKSFSNQQASTSCRVLPLKEYNVLKVH
jgi:hypothetical protein